MMNLSTKEFQMFTELGMSNLIEYYSSPLDIYRMTIERCFLENVQGPAAESLRRAYRAIISLSASRLTPEFDNLIDLY